MRTILLVLIVLFLTTTKAGEVYNQPAPEVEACTKSNSFLIDEINKYREQSGVQPLAENNQLNRSAYNKAVHMSDNGYWDHISPDGKKPWEFIIEAGYNYKTAGENLARNWNCDQQAMAAWTNSPTHKANILHKKYTEVGVSRFNGIIVVHFADK